MFCKAIITVRLLLFHHCIPTLTTHVLNKTTQEGQQKQMITDDGCGCEKILGLFKSRTGVFDDIFDNSFFFFCSSIIFIHLYCSSISSFKMTSFTKQVKYSSNFVGSQSEPYRNDVVQWTLCLPRGIVSSRN